MRPLLFLLLMSAVLVACGDRSEDIRHDVPAATVPASPVPPPAAVPVPSPVIAPLDSGAFVARVKTVYSQQKTSIPKPLLDSAMRLGDPSKINAILEGYMNHRDSVVRIRIAEQFHITLDSVNAVLGKKTGKKK